ncbi:MAG: response regulator transcription factor [Acidimicrobiales bacterium]
MTEPCDRPEAAAAPRVLLVEDDPGIAEPLVEGLEKAGFAVTHVSLGRDALAAPLPDLVLLDLGLPDLDGSEVARTLRAASDVPIIVVSAQGDEIDRVLLLELGADDYVVKPFGLRELVARMRAVLRRARPEPTGDPAGAAAGAAAGDGAEAAHQVFGPLEIDRRSRRVTVAGNEVDLAPREYDLLALLASDPGAVFTREKIIDEVWDPNWWGSTKTLDVHVAAVRRKLGDASWIATIRGVGYRFDPR